jgi:hypothetical protein
MPIQIEIEKPVEYAGNGTRVDFPYQERVLEEDHLVVTIVQEDGTPVATEDYTVDGIGDDEGVTITMNTAPLTGETLRIDEDIPATQEETFPEGSKVPLQTFEDVADKQVKLVSSVKSKQKRSVQLNDGEVDVTEGKQQVPVLQPNKILGTNASNEWVLSDRGGETQTEASGISYNSGTVQDALDRGGLDSLAALKAIAYSSLTDKDTAGFLGYYAAGGGGGNDVYWDATSTETETLGNYFKANGQTTEPGRWVADFHAGINTASFGAVADGSNDDLPSLEDAFDEAISSGYSLILNRTKDFYRISGKLLVTGFVGDIVSNGAQIRLDSTVNDTAVEFEAGTPNISGVLRIYRGVSGASYKDDWKTGNFNETIGLKTNSSARISCGRLDIQGFYTGLYTDCDGTDSLSAVKRMTETNFETIEVLNNKVGWKIDSNNSGFFTDVTVQRFRAGGGNVRDLAGAAGIQAFSGVTGSLQGPQIKSINISDYDSTQAITNATQANPCVITSASHGLQDGDRVLIRNVVGMTELNDIGYQITRIDQDTFSLDGIDSTSFTAYTSGGELSGVGLYFDSPRTLSVLDGYWEGNEVDYFFPTPTNGSDIKPAHFGHNVDEQFLTGVNTSGKPISSTAFSMGSKNVGDSICSVAMQFFKATTNITNATQANPCVITTSGNHNLNTGESVKISGVVGMTELNGNTYAITVLTPTTFELDGVDSTLFTAYTSGGEFSGLNCQVFDSNSAGSLSSYNTRLAHSAIVVNRAGTNSTSTNEGTIQYSLNTAGTELTVTLPGAPLDRTLGATTGFDGSGSSKTLAWKTDLGSATLLSNTLKLEAYDGVSAWDLTTTSGSGAQISVLMIRRKISEQNP